jgi:ssDNA-binding Zn-finger/Zn-ribbon topoisomerase 1
MACTFVSCPRCDSVDMITSRNRWTERSAGFLSGKVDVTYYGTCNDCGKSFSVVVATDVRPGYRPNSIHR